MRGTHKGVYFGIPSTGKQVTMNGISIFHISDGKLVQEWTVFDALGTLQQLGVAPARPRTT